jgi:hypothetical protein
LDVRLAPGAAFGGGRISLCTVPNVDLFTPFLFCALAVAAYFILIN